MPHPNMYQQPYAGHYKPFFSAVYNQEWLILQKIHVLKRDNSSKNAAVYNQEWFQIKSGL